MNDNGAFFKSKDSYGNTFNVGSRKYVGGTLFAQASILLHELAHVVAAAGFKSDYGNDQNGRSNDNLDDKNYGNKSVGSADAHQGTLIMEQSEQLLAYTDERTIDALSENRATHQYKA